MPQSSLQAKAGFGPVLNVLPIDVYLENNHYHQLVFTHYKFKVTSHKLRKHLNILHIIIKRVVSLYNMLSISDKN